MKQIVIVITLILALRSWGMVTVEVQDCPDHFEGRVKEVIGPVEASSFFSANKVILENNRTLKGEVDEQVSLDVLQNGPFIVKKNKDYLVQMRKGKLCWMEEI